MGLENTGLRVAALVVLIIVVAASLSGGFWARPAPPRRGGTRDRAPPQALAGRGGYEGLAPGCASDADADADTDSDSRMGSSPLAERRSAHDAINRLYSTADVDPIVSGHLYENRDFLRPVYAQRTSHGDEWGLVEYSSSGGPGDVGVDQGPYGLAEYGGRQIGTDDGIPAEWAFPSTPVRWYAPNQRDYYGPQGPTPYTEGLFPLTEPDHDVLMP